LNRGRKVAVLNKLIDKLRATGMSDRWPGSC